MKYCKILPSATGDDSDGRPVPVTPASNGKRPCTGGKYWLVFEYEQLNSKQPRNNTYTWVQFALEDKEGGIVEIHTITANVTMKTVKVMNTTKGDFDRVKQRNYHYKYIGKIRESKLF